jgi:hypothetical protein
MFPSTAQVAATGGVLWLLSPALIILGFIVNRRRPWRGLLGRLGGIMLMAFGAVSGFGLLALVINAARFRIEPEAVEALEIVGIHDGRPQDGGCLVRDPGSIRVALGLLATAEAYSPNHERLVSGYRVSLVPKSGGGARYRDILVFPGDAAGTSTTVAIARTSRKVSGMLVEAGWYSAPGFTSWLTATARSSRCE